MTIDKNIIKWNNFSMNGSSTWFINNKKMLRAFMRSLAMKNNTTFTCLKSKLSYVSKKIFDVSMFTFFWVHCPYKQLSTVAIVLQSHLPWNLSDRKVARPPNLLWSWFFKSNLNTSILVAWKSQKATNLRSQSHKLLSIMCFTSKDTNQLPN